MATRRINTMAEFCEVKREFLEKWGDKVIHGTAAEMAQLTKEAEPMAKFARLRPEKMVWALGQDWLARGGSATGKV